MFLQTVVVALLVAACASYAAWTLMPASLRRPLALAILKLPLPRRLSLVLEKRPLATSTCACDGCDKAKAPVAGTTRATPAGAGAAPLVFHPRLRK